VITAAGASQKETAFRLERLGVPVYVLNPQGVDDILASILGVGELVSREQEAQRVVVGLRDRLSAVEQRLLGQRSVRAFPVFFVPQWSAHFPMVTEVSLQETPRR
jgi:ABC-type Fe3+-hydroxamate transport system substrate-binding protein